jgi:hypothetical protein
MAYLKSKKEKERKEIVVGLTRFERLEKTVGRILTDHSNHLRHHEKISLVLLTAMTSLITGGILIVLVMLAKHLGLY